MLLLLSISCLSSTSDRFVVKVHKDVASFKTTASEIADLDPAVRERAFHQETMTGKNGRRFTCYVPNDNAAELATLNKNASDRAKNTTARALFEQLKPAKGSCFQFPEGYWTYEVCPMRNVGQFHMEGKKRSTVFDLGQYEQGKDTLKRAGPGESMMYVQHFSGGTGGRKAVVTYSCGAAKAKVLSVGESPKHTYNIRVETPLLCEQGNASALLAPYHGQCIKKKKGWWTHELCLGQKMRQYHKDKKEKIDQEYLVGSWNQRMNEKLEADGLAIQEEVLMDETGVEQQKTVFVQQYTDGALCDLTKKPRQVTVWHYCAKEQYGVVITSVEETNTCQYTVAVVVPALCKHPRFKKNAEDGDESGSAQTIHCVPGAQ
jgi:hypothetical protein